MPSAEQSSMEAIKSESAPPIEQKIVENAQKENVNLMQNEPEKVPAIQQVISIISNKIRNLEKRKNKLDGYIKEEESGKELSSEQQKAVSKYDEVVQQLSLSKEFCKQFNAIATTASKEAKREARKTMFARQFQETAKVREVLMIQDLLHRLKDERIRKDFLKGQNGACTVEKAEMDFIETFALHVVPSRPKFSNEPSFFNLAKFSADHWSFLIDGRTRPFLDTALTYEKGKELFSRIQACGYWEKDVKVVEVTEESRANTETPSSEDLETKEEKLEIVEEKVLPVSAPAPAQVPTPTFNGNNVTMMPLQQPQVQQPLPQAPMARIPIQTPLPPPTSVPMKTTVTAVENAYFNQMKYSQPHLMGNGLPITPGQSDFGNSNFSFLQESELDTTPTPPGSQTMPVNVISQPKQSPAAQAHQPMQPQVQQQPQQGPPSMATQTYKNSNFHPQSPIPAGQMYPPGLKVQHQSDIPLNYPNMQPLNQQNAAPATQVPPSMIPKQQQPQPVNGNQAPYGASTPPIQQASQQTSRPTYPTMVPAAQYQQPMSNNAQNLQKVEQKPQKLDAAGNNLDQHSGRSAQVQEKEKPREEYQQQPQIDTWTPETANQSGGNNYSSRPGGFNRSNRSSGGTGSERGGAKYNNYRNPQSRNFNENGGGDSNRDGHVQTSGTFFRNNERYNGPPQGQARFEGRGGGGQGGSFKPRDGNYRAGSGRFVSGNATAHGSSNPGQRK